LGVSLVQMCFWWDPE